MINVILFRSYYGAKFIFSFSIPALVMRSCIRRGSDIKINEYDATIRKLHSTRFWDWRILSKNLITNALIIVLYLNFCLFFNEVYTTKVINLR